MFDMFRMVTASHSERMRFFYPDKSDPVTYETFIDEKNHENDAIVMQQNGCEIGRVPAVIFDENCQEKLFEIIRNNQRGSTSPDIQ